MWMIKFILISVAILFVVKWGCNYIRNKMADKDESLQDDWRL